MKALRILALAGMSALAFSSNSQAAVSVFFSAGNNCSGMATVPFTPGGGAVQVSLCMTTTAPTATCGHTVVLQSAAGESGKFTVVSPVTLGANYSDPNSAPTPVPLAISNPPAVADFGGTSSASIPAAANQILNTFNLVPDVSATNGSYVISLAPVSVVAVDSDGTCGATAVPTEQAISATFTLTKTLAPVFTSATSVTFAANQFNTFTVVASGATPITYAVNPTPPGGVSFSTSTGVLSGTPTVNGSFPLTFTATNGSGSTMQSFTLTVSGQASQSINFANPGTQTFSSAPVTLTASATSMLPVVLSSNTPNVCTVSGTSLSMVSLGLCTIVASQSGNAQYLAAANVTQSFGIAGTVPGAPTIGTVTAGDTQASVAFTPPVSNGGSQITFFTANCGGISANGNSSPVTVTGLTNGTTYSCSVTATNALGTGLSSGSAMVTPAAGAMLTLVGVNSRKTHGAQGVFDLPISMTAPLAGTLITVEPRDVGAGHQIVFEFNNAVTSVGGAATVDSAMTAGIGSPMVTFAGNEVTVTLTGAVLVNKRLTVSLSGVNGAGTASVNVGFLMGDMDNSRSVSAGDILLVKGKSGQTTNFSNFIFDIDASGAISAGDILLVKGRSGTALAP